MVKLPPIPEEKLALIRRSVFKAIRRLSIHRTAQGRREGRLRNKKGYTEIHHQSDVLLERMVFAPRPRLNEPNVLATVAAAAGRDDRRFFIRLGKALAKKPKAQPSGRYAFQKMIPPMQVQFLVGHWADDTEEYPALCRLTPEGVLAVLHHKFGPDKVPFETAGIVKFRQRLGLIPLRRPKTHVILIGGRLKLCE